MQAGGKRGYFKEVMQIAWPLIISSGTNAVMQFCDRVFLARYDSTSIQAALPAGVLSFTLCCLFQAVAGYSGTFAAQYCGAGDTRSTLKSAVQGLWISVLTLPLILLLIPAGYFIIDVCGHSLEVRAAEKLYFLILMLGGGLLSVNAALSGYFSGIGRTKLTMVANVAGTALNLLLDYLFIFGHWGFPQMGIAGAGIATVIGLSLPCLIQGWVFAKDIRKGTLAGHSRKLLLMPDLPLLSRICRFGVPAGLHQLVDVGAFAVFVMMTGRLDALSLAASNIGFSINHLAFAPLFGIGVAASVVVGQHQGARDSDSAVRAGWSSVKIGFIYMTVIGGSFALLPDFYYTLFGAGNADYTIDQLLTTGRPLMRLMAFWGFFEVLNIILGGALKGAGDTKFVMWYITIGGWGVWLPSAALALSLGADILTQWMIISVYCVFLAVGFLIRWRLGRWRTIRVIEEPTVPENIPPYTSPV